MHRNQSAMTHQFAMVPKGRIPRSTMKQQCTHKTTIDASYLYPVLVDELLPGDHITLKHVLFGRLSTPLYPLMDNLYLDSFYFVIPKRLIWTNFKKMMGEQATPGASISYVVPQQVSPAGGYASLSLQDYMGLPVSPMLTGSNTKSHSAYWTRAYNLTWNDWFRDQNLQTPAIVDLGDGPDASASTNYVLRRRGKRHDYFTSGLPFPQKGATGVTVPLLGTAPVVTNNLNPTFSGLSGVTGTNDGLQFTDSGSKRLFLNTSTGTGTVKFGNQSGLQTDLSAASGVLINQLRSAIMIQELLEVDARGGTRYIESVLAHFGVVSPDARQQRPEYVGGGSSYLSISPIAQTTPSSALAPSPQGTLAAVGTVLSKDIGFSYAATEDCVLLGLVACRADLTYQQGLRRMWTRSTRYDHYFPSFAHLGEQAIRRDEIYCDGSASDLDVFAYKEAWAEYRYKPNMVTGLFRSVLMNGLDAWHCAEFFGSAPTLNDTFISDHTKEILERNIAVGDEADGQQIILDCFFDITMTRAMPLYSVPGISSHL